MSVRVKVACNFKSQTTGDNPVTQLSFYPVYTGSEENKKFFSLTPGGMFIFNTVNQDAANQFEVGKEYYFDIFAAEQ